MTITAPDLVPDILVIGRSTLDILIRCSPRLNADELGILSAYRVGPGGSAVNIAVSLAQLGARTALTTRVGQDAVGQLLRDELSTHGIACMNIVEDPCLSTSLSIINVQEDGEIGILHHEGASRSLALEDIAWPDVEKADVIHVGGTFFMRSLDGDPTARLMKDARDLGKLTSLSTSRNTRRRAVLLPVLKYLNLLIMNRKEAFEVTECDSHERAASWLRSRGVQRVVITLGGAGVYVQDYDFDGIVPAFYVHPTDTTGCGDAFIAGFLYATCLGLDVKTCAFWGNAVGAHCARSLGAVPVSFNRQEIEAMIAVQIRRGGVAALVLAGGRGHRMGAARQKVALNICGKPIIFWVVEALRQAGVHRIIVLLGHDADAVRSALDRQPVEFHVVETPESGTGATVRESVKHLSRLPETVLVMNGDTPLVRSGSLQKLVNEFTESNAEVVACTATSPDTGKYSHGTILRAKDEHFVQIEHTITTPGSPSPREINVGTYCFQRDALLRGTSKLAESKDGTVHFSDILTVMKQDHARVHFLHCPDFTEFISVNTPELLEESETLMAFRLGEQS